MHPRLEEVKVISCCGNHLWFYSSEVPGEGGGSEASEKGSGKTEAGVCQRGPWELSKSWRSCPVDGREPLKKVETPG